MFIVEHPLLLELRSAATQIKLQRWPTKKNKNEGHLVHLMVMVMVAIKNASFVSSTPVEISEVSTTTHGPWIGLNKIHKFF